MMFGNEEQALNEMFGNDLAGMMSNHTRPALEQALNEGADVNMLDETGSTLLMIAAAVGEVEALRLLVDSKASLDIQAKGGRTALDFVADFHTCCTQAYNQPAALKQETECAELLIAAALERDLIRVAQTE